MSAAQLTAICKQFAGSQALTNVDVSFPEKKVTALVGRSGSGKSTLLKLLNGLQRPDSGVLQIFGQTINYQALVPLRRKIGYAVQGTGLFPHMSVEQNIGLLARLEKWDEPRIKARLQCLLEMVQLDDSLLQRYPHQLSGGQQQRVGLCRAMVLDPPLLLLDEPFAALDPITRGEIHRELLQLQSLEPRTIIIVTHDMREAMTLSDYVIVMAAGTPVHQSSTRELHDLHQDEDPDSLLLDLLQRHQ